ncbi:MAG: nucleotidyltransferase family protein [Candidatus Gorgyraea atricola]|nr:nucleotidyltransferase family protein [Candidatus Gorgyraea atricola]
MTKKNNPKKMRENINLFLVNKRLTIKDAMKRMDQAGEKILFLVDKNMRLLGSLTDGDMRRWILNEGVLSEKIDKVFNSNPFFVKEDYDLEAVKDLMIKEKIEWLPVIDRKRRVIDILFWEDIFQKKKKNGNNLNIPVVVMAGGEGLRLNPFTRILPKPLIPIGEDPVSKIIMDRFSGFGCKNFYMILCYKSEMVKTYFSNVRKGYEINYIQEKKPLGTAGGLQFLPKDIAEDFFVTNCDAIIKADYSDIYRFHKEKRHDITLIASMQHLKVPYGVVEIDNPGSLKKIVEKPEYDFLANTGMYVLSKKVLDFIPKNKVFHITDLIHAIKKAGRNVGVYPVSGKSWMDVGQWEEYRKTLTEFNEWVKT